MFSLLNRHKLKWKFSRGQTREIRENNHFCIQYSEKGVFFQKQGLEQSKTTKAMLPYFGKRKQVTKVTFLVKEQNVSIITTDVNGISWCLT